MVHAPSMLLTKMDTFRSLVKTGYLLTQVEIRWVLMVIQIIIKELKEARHILRLEFLLKEKHAGLINQEAIKSALGQINIFSAFINNKLDTPTLDRFHPMLPLAGNLPL